MQLYVFNICKWVYICITLFADYFIALRLTKTCYQHSSHGIVDSIKLTL